MLWKTRDRRHELPIRFLCIVVEQNSAGKKRGFACRMKRFGRRHSCIGRWHRPRHLRRHCFVRGTVRIQCKSAVVHSIQIAISCSNTRMRLHVFLNGIFFRTADTIHSSRNQFKIPLAALRIANQPRSERKRRDAFSDVFLKGFATLPRESIRVNTEVLQITGQYRVAIPNDRAIGNVLALFAFRTSTPITDLQCMRSGKTYYTKKKQQEGRRNNEALRDEHVHDTLSTAARDSVHVGAAGATPCSKTPSSRRARPPTQVTRPGGRCRRRGFDARAWYLFSHSRTQRASSVAAFRPSSLHGRP